MRMVVWERSLEKVVGKVVWEWEWSHGCSRMGEFVLTPSLRRLPPCPWRVRDLEVAKSGQRPRPCEPPNTSYRRKHTGGVPGGNLILTETFSSGCAWTFSSMKSYSWPIRTPLSHRTAYVSTLLRVSLLRVSGLTFCALKYKQTRA